MSAASTATLRCGVLAYGPSRRLHLEASMALLTLREFAPRDADVVVFTDHPSVYTWLARHVTVERLTDDTIAAWRGPSKDRFRPKIEALRRLAGDGADALLVDADTMARASLVPLAEHLSAGGFVLHEREYQVSRTRRQGDQALKKEILGQRWRDIAADENTWMWNGGVIGSSGKHPRVLDTALDVFDQMRAVSTHFALEQLAYSIVFPAYGPVREAKHWFDHYWANRSWFDRRIERFLSDVLLDHLTPEAAGQRLRRSPISGPLDGRVPWWRNRLRRLLRIEIDDDADTVD